MESDPSSEERGSHPVPFRSRFEILSEPSGGRAGAAPPSYGRSEPWEQEQGLDWRQVLHTLWKRKLWIVLATLAGIGAGFLLAHTVNPVYETRSTIWVETSDDQTGPIQAEEIFRGSGWADLFTSFAVLDPVVRDLDLYLDGQSRETGLAASLGVTDSIRAGKYRLRRDSAGQSYVLSTEADGVLDRAEVGTPLGEEYGFDWSPSADLLEPGASVTFGIVSPTQAALRLRRNLQVNYNPRSGNLITTHLTWTRPAEAERIHNRVVETFLDVAADLKSKKLREVVETLEQQTQYAEERLTEAELALENARVNNVTLPTESQASPIPIPGAEQSRGPVFDTYFEKKVSLDQLTSDLNELEAILRTQQQGGDLDVLRLRGVPSLERSPELQASLEELATKEAERRSLLYTYTEQHPQVKELEREIATLRQQTIPGQVRQLAAQLRSEIRTLEEEIQAQERELREVPPRLIEEERLRREMQQAEELHTNLLNRLKNAQLAASTSRPNLQVVDRAQEPTSPTSNQGPRLFFLASMAGLGLGIAGALLRDRFDSSVQEPEDIQRQLGLPVLGLVPRLPADGSDEAEARTVLESFRSIRAQLTRSFEPGQSTVLVTSPEPRDGKSLVSANLAISFASSRKRTLLIDGDTRRGNAERLFGLSPKPGLTDCLTGGVPLAEALKATEVPGLVLLPHGKLRGFDPDYLDGPEMDEILREVRDRFDVIIVDGPPLAAGPDAALLGEQCDQVLFVLRTGVTDRDVARARLDGLAGFDVPLVGAVLNDVPDTAPYYRYYAPYRYYLEEGEVVS